MVTTDPVKAAQIEAARQVDERVALVRDLRDAVEAEKAVRGVQAATKDVLAGLPPELADQAQTVRDAVAALLSAAGENTRTKRAAASGPDGWSTEQLRGFGLLPVRQAPRKKRPAAAPSTGSADRAGVAERADSEATASPAPTAVVDQESPAAEAATS
jgi:hypothetical protein